MTAPTIELPPDTYLKWHLSADARELLIKALAGVRWGFFGECRTQGWDKDPPTPKETSDALEAAIAAIQRENK